MDRIAPNAFKLVLLTGAWLLAVLFGLLLSAVHYAGLAEAFTLLRLDTAPLGDDPLAGLLFTGIAADADFAHLEALVVSATIFAVSWAACNRAIHTFAVLMDAPEHIRQGEGAALRRTLSQSAFWLMLFVALLVPLIMLDTSLLRLRGLIGIDGGQRENVLGSLLAFNSLPADTLQLAAVQLYRGPLIWGYAATAIAIPVILDYLASRIHETWQVLQVALYGTNGETELEAEPLDETPDLEEAEAAHADLPEAETVAADPSPSRSPAAAAPPPPTVQHEVLGQPGRSITLSEAISRPDAYHVVRDLPVTVYDRPYWEAIQSANSAEEVVADTTINTNSPEKEAA